MSVALAPGKFKGKSSRIGRATRVPALPPGVLKDNMSLMPTRGFQERRARGIWAVLQRVPLAVQLFIAMFCKFTALDETFVRRMLFEHGGNALAITCKAGGVGKAIFASIFALTRNKQSSTEDDVRAEMRKCLAIYNKTTQETAMETVRRWRSNASS